jgi:hypothetical protein
MNEAPHYAVFRYHKNTYFLYCCSDCKLLRKVTELLIEYFLMILDRHVEESLYRPAVMG